jgi:hypothetical protein
MLLLTAIGMHRIACSRGFLANTACVCGACGAVCTAVSVTSALLLKEMLWVHLIGGSGDTRSDVAATSPDRRVPLVRNGESTERQAPHKKISRGITTGTGITTG